MQDLSLLASEGILTFDPNAYLNAPSTGANPYAQIGLLPSDTKLQAQPTQDSFVSRNKNTIKKVAAGAIIAGLAVFGLYKGKTCLNKVTEMFSSKQGTDVAAKAAESGKGFVNTCIDSVKKFFK